MTVPAEWVVTPHRGTAIQYDPPRYELRRPTWYHKRTAGLMEGQKAPGTVQSENTLLLAGEAWILNPLKGSKLNALTSEFSAGLIDASDVNLAPGMVRHYSFRRRDELVNVNYGGNVISQGIPTFRKAYAPDADLSLHRLAADELAFPKPEDGDFAPLDRVLAGRVTYPPNSGFIVSVTRPPFTELSGPLGTFYWGGQTDTDPLGSRGGEFAAVLCGDGKVRLYEYTGNGAEPWAKRKEIDGLPNDAPPNLLTFAFAPFGRDRMYLGVAGGDFAAIGLFAGVATVTLNAGRSRTAFHEDPKQSRHTHRKSLTGPGTIRLDQRRDIRQVFSILRLLYPATGKVVDKPFALPWPKVQADQALRLVVDWEGPSETNVTGQLYNAETHVALTTNENGEFLTHENQKSYYAVFTLSSNLVQTPLLNGYQVEMVGTSELTAPPGTVTEWVQSISISGPDITPDLETAHYEVQDINSDHTPLNERGTVPIRITTTADADGNLSVLFQGDTIDPEALQRGPTPKGLNDQWPADDWKYYDVVALGEWGRVAERQLMNPEFFGLDEQATADPKTGQKPPKKVTDILRYTLSDICGYPAEMVDIPDLPLRLWSTDKNDYWLSPGASIPQFLIRLTRDYLGAVLLFDPNAGDYGMWRLKQAPTAPFTNLAEFVMEPEEDNRLVHDPGSYGDGKTFILRGSYRPKRKRPEGNFVLVIGAGGLEKGPDGKYKLAVSIANPNSFSFPGFPPASDRSHPDYLGRFVPIVRSDPMLQTLDAVRFVARRTFDLACHGQDWVRFIAPLLLVTDPDDEHQTNPRPLRIYDPVLVNGRQALLRSVSPDYERDWQQWARYEAILEPE